MRFWDLFLNSLFGRGDRPDSDTLRDSASGVMGVATLDSPDRAGSKSDKPVEHWWKPNDGALIEPPLVTRPELSPEALALERILVGYFEKTDLHLPSLPKVAERVLRLLSGRAYDARKIADEISADQVVSVAVLRLANSALYGRTNRVNDLHTAVARLGCNVLRSVMLQHSLQAALQHRKGGDRCLASIVWNGSLASAQILRGLAEFVGVEPEEAYLVGLLHDIGAVLVLREVQEQEALLRYKIKVGEFVWLSFEYHQRLGQLIADAWDLPDKLKVLVTDHHSRAIAGDEAAPERNMITMADMLKAMLGYAAPGSYDLLHSTAAQSLGLDAKPGFAAFLDGLPEELRSIPTSF
jgi:HD-like signal output (HDOD) protein